MPNAAPATRWAASARLGQQRPTPVLIESSVLDAPALWINAGQRGLLLELAGAEIVHVLGARAYPLCE